MAKVARLSGTLTRHGIGFGEQLNWYHKHVQLKGSASSALYGWLTPMPTLAGGSGVWVGTPAVHQWANCKNRVHFQLAHHVPMECRDCSTSTTVSDESFPCSVLSSLPIGGLLPPPSSVDISSVCCPRSWTNTQQQWRPSFFTTRSFNGEVNAVTEQHVCSGGMPLDTR